MFTVYSKPYVAHLRINDSVKDAVELNVDSHHSLATLDIESVNVRRVFQVIVFRVSLARSRSARFYDSE